MENDKKIGIFTNPDGTEVNIDPDKIVRQRQVSGTFTGPDGTVIEGDLKEKEDQGDTT
jgi:hypothetical protein